MRYLLVSALFLGLLPLASALGEDVKPVGEDTEVAKVFHGFYYTSKKDNLVKLVLGTEETKALQKLLAEDFKELTEEKYWLSFGRFMITHAPQAYIAWEGKSLWLVQLDKVG